MTSFLGRLSDIGAPPILLDGAVGTALGGRFGDAAPCLLTVDHPDAVRDLHAAYFTAGADAVHTASFGATRGDLERSGRAADVRRINLAAALLAREVCPHGRWVLGDVSPPWVPAAPAAMLDGYAEQCAFLAEGGVDLIHLETFHDPAVLAAALAGARRGAPHLPVIASLALRDLAASVSGAPLAELMAAAGEADALGLNCALAPQPMLAALTAARARSPRVVLFQPVANDPPIAPAAFAALLVAATRAGARAVGGCCGSTPEHIRAVRAALAG